MLEAHLRGLIIPGNRFGFQSRLRLETLMTALSFGSQLDALSTYRKAWEQLAGSIHVSAQNRRKAMRHIQDLTRTRAQITDFDVWSLLLKARRGEWTAADESSAQAMGKAFQRLESSGALDKIKQFFENMEKELTPLR